MSNAINAIPLHYMDYVGATVDERRDNFHKHCHKSFCKFLELPSHEQENYQPTDRSGNAKDNDLYIKDGESVMQVVTDKFKELGHVNIMRRCTRFLNQNVNESLHSRLYNICNKTKFYK